MTWVESALISIVLPAPGLVQFPMVQLSITMDRVFPATQMFSSHVSQTLQLEIVGVDPIWSRIPLPVVL